MTQREFENAAICRSRLCETLTSKGQPAGRLAAGGARPSRWLPGSAAAAVAIAVVACTETVTSEKEGFDPTAKLHCRRSRMCRRAQQCAASLCPRRLGEQVIYIAAQCQQAGGVTPKRHAARTDQQAEMAPTSWATSPSASCSSCSSRSHTGRGACGGFACASTLPAFLHQSAQGSC